MSVSTRSTNETGETMDRIYGVQRHFYDLTRKWFLIGRDTLIRQMDVRPGDRVLEVGCGTARNLIKLAKLRDCELFGLDASEKMLRTATAKVNQARLGGRIRLERGLAENLELSTFGVDRSFDAVFFSYSLSMIESWEVAIDRAIRCVKVGGVIYFVDFWDNRDLPSWFQWVNRKWLALSPVEARPELLEHLQRLAAEGKGSFEIDTLAGRYAFIARFTKTSEMPMGAE